MAVDNPVSSQTIFTWKNFTYVLSNFHYGASLDTVKCPLGSISAAVLMPAGLTAPTTSISQGAPSDGVDTVTLTGGSTNTGGCVLVTKHSGNLAGAR